MADKNQLIAGFLFFILASQFLVFLMISESLVPGYSIHDNVISDLGVSQESALLFNTSIFFVGLLEIIGALFFHVVHRRVWITIAFILSGIGGIGVAIFTLNSGLHGIFALLAFIFGNIQAIVTATVLKRPMNVISILSGVIGLIFLILFISSDLGAISLYGPIGHGGLERMIVYPILIWSIALGGYLMVTHPESEEEAINPGVYA